MMLRRLHRHVKNTGFRAASFKVIEANFDKNEAVIQQAEEKAKIAGGVLKLLHDFAKAGGGSKAIHRHTTINKKLLVRERLRLLLDENSPFLEIGLLAGMFMDYGNIPTAGIVVGIGKINGKFCIVGANDATVKGGAFFPVTVKKQMRMQQLAFLNALPCIYLVDSAGAFLPLQAEIFPDANHGGRSFYNEAVLSSLGIPQIAVVCGSSTAGGAYCPTMAEEAIIVKNSGLIFLGGPPLVKAATGEIVSEQDLGGAHMHCSISGCTDYYAENEEEAFEMCRESVLTFNFTEYSKPLSYEQPVYPSQDLLCISGKSHLSKTDLYIVLSRILDGSRFKEFKAKFGSNLIAGFGYIHGMLLGVLANSGSPTLQDAQKGTHFIQLCEKRNVPICFLQNSASSEDSNFSTSYDCLKCRAQMVSAHCSSKVPKISICLSRCFTDDNFTMCGLDFHPNFFLSWPLAHLTTSSAKANSFTAEEIKNAVNMKDVNDCDTLFENKTSAFHHASHMMCDAVIPPESTREVLALCLEIVMNKKVV